MLLDSPNANHVLARYVSYANDTVLLLAGVLLMQLTQQYPVAQAWLSVKFALLLVYIVLGVFALRRGRTKAHRAGFFVAALMAYLFMFFVARNHDPAGFFHAF